MKHKIKKVNSKDLIYSDGEKDRTLYLIKQGRVQLFNEIEGKIIEGMTVFSGGVVGELAFFDGLPRESCARAVMNCILIAIKNEDMQEKLGAIPSWFSTVLTAIVGRARNTEMNVVSVASKGASMDYATKELKNESYTYMERDDFLKIVAVLSMTSAKYGRQGVSSLEVNYDVFNQFVVRFQLGTKKMEAALRVLEEHWFVKREDLGEGRVKLEIPDIGRIDSLIQSLMEQSDMETLRPESVRALNSMQVYLKDEPAMANGRKVGNVVRLQERVLSAEKFFLKASYFKLLEEAGFIQCENFSGGSGISSDFSFDPGKIEACLPAQKVLSSLEFLNREY